MAQRRVSPPFLEVTNKRFVPLINKCKKSFYFLFHFFFRVIQTGHRLIKFRSSNYMYCNTLLANGKFK
uniref:Putative ovule protein n=1 Tax=Solanum chacoense TaxID=4108 RepID=A0A0V0H494_SOLCH